MPSEKGSAAGADAGRAEIANYTRAIAKRDFSSLEQALGAAEQRRATLQAELAKLDGGQPSAVIQLTPAALEHRLQGITEKLRSGVNGKVREAIEQSITRILVGVDGSLTIEAKPGGLLGLERDLAPGGQEDPTLFMPTTISIAGRQRKLIVAEGRRVVELRSNGEWPALSREKLGGQTG